MKKELILLGLAVLCFASAVKANVEWTIWEGEVTNHNVQGAKLDFSTLEAGDIIYVYGSGTLSKAIYRISGDNWDTWTNLVEYSPAVSDGDNYYHVITEEFLTNFNYSSDDTKSWAVGNWDTGTITKVTIRKGKSMIKTTLSSESKSADTFEYTIAKENFSNMVAGDYLYLPASKRDAVDEKYYKVEFKEAENDWTTYTTLWGPTHDAIWQVGSDIIIDKGIKDHPLYVYGELYNAEGVYMYHSLPSFSIGSIGYATFSAAQEVTAPNSVTAYRGTISGDKLVLTPFTDNVIPANTGAIIAGAEGAVLEFTASATGSTETSDLHANTSATDVTSLSSGYDYYVLYNNPTGGNTALSLSDLSCGWGSSYDPETKNITFEDEWKGRGWGWNFDYSDYSKVVVEFGSAAKSGALRVQYNYPENYTETVDYAEGATSVEIDLNTSYKNNINQIYLTASAASSLTLTAAYLVSNDGSQKAEFRKTTSGTLKANKAYLAIPQSAGVRAFSVAFEDEEATGIESLTLNQRGVRDSESEGRIYNLAGQRISKLQKGLNIVNGKKVLVK